MKKFAVVVAGGSGTRMMNAVPKQFLLLKGKPVLMHTLLHFHEADPQIKLIVVLPDIHFDYWKQLCEQHSFFIEHHLIRGGETRFHSVKNGLTSITDAGLVAVHDAVRPLLTTNFINHLFEVAAKEGNAIPVIPVNETIRIVAGDTSKTMDRSHFRIVQTPQVFDVNKLQNAFEQPYTSIFTDEASVMEAAGEKIFLTTGEPLNIKITTPGDLIFAEGVI